MATPMVPQRPARSQNTSNTQPSLDLPQVPPRPTRNVERSRSPGISQSRSPLNDSPFASNIPSGEGLSRPKTLTKPPSVSSLPLIGQEGMEYASFDQMQNANAADVRPDSPNETRNISGDLPIHAPKASVAPAAAKEQLAPVTRVDSAQAASSGIGKSHTEYDESDLPSRTREYRPPSAASHDLTRTTSRPTSSRPESFHSDEHEHGIPAIGLQVPIYPNAGDVQAPFPGSGQLPPSTGIGFFNSGAKSSSPHGRRRSFQGPPGSYGLHGHGVIHNDQFEKTWYQKHPDELTKEEQGAYGPGMIGNRSQWALSSDDLNKIVRDTANKHAHGTAPPDEDFGYKLSEEYTSRNNSPQLRAVKSRTLSQTYAESPLRQASFPDDVHGAHTFDSENEDDHLHLGPPRGTPALASDEQVKSPSAPGMLPAVSPAAEKAGDDDYFAAINTSPTHTRPTRSRPTSRPGSARFHHDMEGHGTPLDEIDEYEPLFTEDDEDGQARRPVTAADKLKRPEMDRRRFPSQDIWEDTPTSLQLHTTVSGPQEPEEVAAAAAASRAAGSNFETPEQEQARIDQANTLERTTSYLDDENQRISKMKFRSGVEDELRPGMARRFPSRDIWEDTPTSQQLVTTIDEARAREAEEASAAAAAGQDKPTIPARPVRTKAVESVQSQPTVPPRPSRAKPQIPPRPVKTSSQEDQIEGSPLSKSISPESADIPETTSPTDRSVTGSKPKPAVPSKPAAGSSKFASIKAGFMNDLNSRLQLGPQVKKPTPAESEAAQEEEKAPLGDARKARARGPIRRKPADSAPAPTAGSASTGWSIVKPFNTWSISNIDGDDVIVGAPKASDSAPSEPVVQTNDVPEEAQEDAADDEQPAPSIATNTAGDSVAQEPVEPPEPSERADSEKDDRAAADEEAAQEKLKPVVEQQVIGAEGDRTEAGGEKVSADAQ